MGKGKRGRKDKEERKRVKGGMRAERKSRGEDASSDQSQGRLRSPNAPGETEQIWSEIFRDLFSQMSWGQNSKAWETPNCVLSVVLGRGAGWRGGKPSAEAESNRL